MMKDIPMKMDLIVRNDEENHVDPEEWSYFTV